MADERRDIDQDLNRTDAPDRNPDPITKAPGSHPIGTGVGAAAAGAAGAAIGSVVPGAGTVIGGAIGAVVGAVAGGLAGKGVAEAINPTEEDEYWSNEYRNRPYYRPGTDYDEYAPAYRHGYTAASQYQGKSWDEMEMNLERDWDNSRGKSSMDWDRARQPARDAWDRAATRVASIQNQPGQGSNLNNTTGNRP